MNQLASFRKRIDKDVIVRLKRSLKGSGKILVALGQEVTPSDIIGSSMSSSGFRILELAKSLDVPPSKVSGYLKKIVGQRVYKDELLAYKSGGIFSGKKIVTAPTDGILDFINPKTGEIRLTFFPKKSDLPAGVYGIVEYTNPASGMVIIKTQVSRIWGMFGSGKLRDGNLLISSARDSLINKSEISFKNEGHILVSGSLISRDDISRAISNNVAGIISGGINARDYKAVAGGRLNFQGKNENDIGVSIIVCEGFGLVPVGEDIFNMLLKFNGKFVSLDGNKALVNLPSFESKSMTYVRNSHLPPLKIESDQDLKQSQTGRLGQLEIGSFVRVVGNTYQGEQGKIVAIDRTMTLLPSSIKAYLVTVETKRRKIKVPVANIEIIDYSFTS